MSNRGMTSMVAQNWPLLICAALVLILCACGHKAPVKPLEIPVPGPSKALELRQQGDSLLLSWQLPTVNLDGSPIKEPPLLDIFRMTYDPAADCPECFDRSTLLVSINPELPEPARKIGDRFLFRDRQVEAGIGYQYKLIARSADGQPGKPVILRLPMLPPPAAPPGLQGKAQDRSVLLHWRPAPLAEADQLLGYRVYRHPDGAASAPAPVNAQPLQKTSFEDFSLENGKRYHYLVRTLVKRGEETLEGLPSEEISLVPQAGL